MKKRFLHISEEFEYTWIGKDNGMIPIYMQMTNKYSSSILTCNLKKDLPDSIRGITFIKVKRFFNFLPNFAYSIKLIRRINLFKYLIKNAKKIDILMLFHISRCSYWYSYLYKKINPKGKIYVKADFNLNVYTKEVSIINSSFKNLREFFRKKRETKEYRKRKALVKIVDLISYETIEAYEQMKDEYAGIDTKGKTIYLPNGYDDKFIEKITKKSLKEKENIILTVGRLGTKEKNTELLLESLKEIELKNWQVILIGSIEKSFIPFKDKFFKENPKLKNKIIFTGQINDKELLYNYYNRAKVFVLPSRWESFGIVMLEAMAFGNFIITSDTCAAKDITNNGKTGKIISIDSKEELKLALKSVINENINLEKKYKETLKYVTKFKYSVLINTLDERIQG
ncbi:MAG: glycosyltransferase family 4 protein [Fusobacterium sp.]|uniref:glycosyltransferase family 4 protein n=1 Tax=Fusobacterium sp. TaxID=68766 RepID=UPI0026DD5F1C|nr:glycosyltransferase family 4 protein [Fusobacterium sp.]MDO4690978.1 glycosyltransferase family 4 protein [Fusobacterium sp.]